MTELTIAPTSFLETTRFYTVADTGDAAFFRRSRHPLTPRSFRVRFARLTAAEKTAITDLFEETAGGAGVFQYAPPGESAIDVRFDSELTFRADGPGGRYSTELELSALRPQD